MNPNVRKLKYYLNSRHKILFQNPCIFTAIFKDIKVSATLSATHCTRVQVAY